MKRDRSVTARNRVARLMRREYRLLIKNNEKGGWRSIGTQFGVSGAMAFRIAIRGYDPKQMDIRARLGLPTSYLALACRRCGQVHTTRRCVNVRSERGPTIRRNWKALALMLAGLWAQKSQGVWV